MGFATKKHLADVSLDSDLLVRLRDLLTEGYNRVLLPMFVYYSLAKSDELKSVLEFDLVDFQEVTYRYSDPDLELAYPASWFDERAMIRALEEKTGMKAVIFTDLGLELLKAGGMSGADCVLLDSSVDKSDSYSLYLVWL